jgi:hypothetical protein
MFHDVAAVCPDCCTLRFYDVATSDFLHIVYDVAAFRILIVAHHSRRFALACFHLYYPQH